MRGRRLPKAESGAQEAGPSLFLWRSLLSWGPRGLLGDLAAQGQEPWGLESAAEKWSRERLKIVTSQWGISQSE